MFPENVRCPRYDHFKIENHDKLVEWGCLFSDKPIIETDELLIYPPYLVR